MTEACLNGGDGWAELQGIRQVTHRALRSGRYGDGCGVSGLSRGAPGKVGGVQHGVHHQVQEQSRREQNPEFHHAIPENTEYSENWIVLRNPRKPP